MTLTKDQREAIEFAVHFMSEREPDFYSLRVDVLNGLRSLLAAPSADDARDAERYRLVRDVSREELYSRYGVELDWYQPSKNLDAILDAVIAQRGDFERLNAGYNAMLAAPTPSDAQPASDFECAARKDSGQGGNTPADCGWPQCGCDPHVERVISGFQECGYEMVEVHKAQPASGADDAARYKEALEQIVETHSGHCEHHVGVSRHSYDLATIAEEALAASIAHHAKDEI